jgi:hypothetical protein
MQTRLNAGHKIVVGGGGTVEDRAGTNVHVSDPVLEMQKCAVKSAQTVAVTHARILAKAAEPAFCRNKSHETGRYVSKFTERTPVRLQLSAAS